jgi:hypothetical protein
MPEQFIYEKDENALEMYFMTEGLAEKITRRSFGRKAARFQIKKGQFFGEVPRFVSPADLAGERSPARPTAHERQSDRLLLHRLLHEASPERADRRIPAYALLPDL